MKFTSDAELAVETPRCAARDLRRRSSRPTPTTATTSCPASCAASWPAAAAPRRPFSYLVPDADLLPPESIRFFYLDRDWTDALVQGALSVGTITHDRPRPARGGLPAHPRRGRRDRAHDPPARRRGAPRRRRRHDHRLPAALAGGVGLARRCTCARTARDVAAPTTRSPPRPSPIPERMKLLRMERLAPAVLLVLFDGVPEVVHIEEPRQGIQFGVRLDTDDPPTAAARQGARCATPAPATRSRRDDVRRATPSTCRSAPARRA